MKKYFALLLLGLLSISEVYSQAALKSEDFLFLKESTSILFPELSYSRNPAVLFNIKSPFLINTLDAEGILEESILKRSDDSIGEKGGTNTVSSLTFIPDFDMTLFLPLEKKKVFGINLNFNSTHKRDSTTLINYNSISENLITESRADIFTAGTDLFMALSTQKKVNLGFSLGYNFNYDPKVFRWVTDKTYNPELIYTDLTADSDYIDVITHGMTGAAGFNLAKGKNIFSVGLTGGGFFKNKSREYKSIDTDADGYKDTLYTLQDYYFLKTEDGGPIDTVSAFDSQNYIIGTNAVLTASALLPGSKNSTLVFNGSYKVVDYAKDHYYSHVLTDTAKTDESYYDQIYNCIPGSFDLLVGLNFIDPKKTKKFRIGLDYIRTGDKYRQSGDTAAGLDLYNTLNPGHYTELNLGINPLNDSLSGSGLYPAVKETNKLMLLARYQWMPARKVNFYYDFNLSVYKDINTYRAYNIDTRSIWEESVVSENLNWETKSLIGLAFPVGKKLTGTVNLEKLSSIGDVSVNTETLPYDTDLDRYSESSGDSLSTEKGIDIKFNVGFLASW